MPTSAAQPQAFSRDARFRVVVGAAVKGSLHWTFFAKAAAASRLREDARHDGGDGVRGGQAGGTIKFSYYIYFKLFVILQQHNIRRVRR